MLGSSSAHTMLTTTCGDVEPSSLYTTPLQMVLCRRPSLRLRMWPSHSCRNAALALQQVWTVWEGDQMLQRAAHSCSRTIAIAALLLVSFPAASLKVPAPLHAPHNLQGMLGEVAGVAAARHAYEGRACKLQARR